jgi:hypothetical protein
VVLEDNTIANNMIHPTSDCLSLASPELASDGSGSDHDRPAIAMSPSSRSVIQRCIFAFNAGAPLVANLCDSISIIMTDIFGNGDGDWTGCLADLASIDGNMSVDPLFCDMANGDYHLSGSSPCAPANSSSGELIGALDIACSLCGDFDNSGVVDIVDVVCYINWMFSQGLATENTIGSDNNCDGRPNIADVVYLINYIFRAGPQPCAECK